MNEFSKIYTPALIGITLLILLFITRPMYSTYFEANATTRELEQSKKEKQNHYDDLKKMETDLASVQTNSDPAIQKLKEQVDRYKKPFDPTEVMREIFLNYHTKPLSGYTLIITGVEIGKGTKLPSGLTRSLISVQTQSTSLDALIAYIDYLTSESRIPFVIHNITLPLDTSMSEATSGGYSVPLQFELYYYE